MRTYQLRRAQFLPIPVSEAWDFFSSPKNLSVITPAKMNFRIVSITGGDKMFPGQEISYKVTVLPFVRMKWVTKITEVREPDYFIDTQLEGPYTLWHHKHIFRSVEGGVDMIDELDYVIPLGVLGQLANWLLVEKEVKGIFDYRNEILQTYFNEGKKQLRVNVWV
jgi:ligand-binding SRPBCC domain-containing protein